MTHTPDHRLLDKRAWPIGEPVWGPWCTVCLDYIRPEDDERERVMCAEDCFAFQEPVTADEYRAAYEHWRGHDVDFGCSHGR